MIIFLVILSFNLILKFFKSEQKKLVLFTRTKLSWNIQVKISVLKKKQSWVFAPLTIAIIIKLIKKQNLKGKKKPKTEFIILQIGYLQILSQVGF